MSKETSGKIDSSHPKVNVCCVQHCICCVQSESHEVEST